MNLWTPLSQSFINDPYPVYETIRNHAPVYQTRTDEYVITDYHLIQQILKDKINFRVGNSKEWLQRSVVYFKSKDRDFTAISEALNSFILLINPPRHKELRKFITEAWPDKEVDQIIRDNCESLIGDLPKKPFDFIESFASKLPTMTIGKILGLKEPVYNELRVHGEQMIKALDFYLRLKDLVKIDESAKAFISQFRKIVQKRPTDGLIKRIIDLNKGRNSPLSENELVSICIFLFVAGEETTTSFLSTSVYNLLKEDKWSDITNNELEAVVNELLRYDGPVQLLGRISNNDLKIKDAFITKEKSIILCLAAANRDPKVFKKPNSINYKRSQKNLAFGSGIHFCLGDWLAKKQAYIALEVLARELPHLSMEQQQIRWKNQLAIRRLKSLWLRY